MHELPKDLSNSLRSWRGSIYGNQSIRHVTSDLEKGPDDYGEKQAALSPQHSSLILVCSVHLGLPFMSIDKFFTAPFGIFTQPQARSTI